MLKFQALVLLLFSFDTIQSQYFEESTIKLGINHRHVGPTYIGGGVALFDFNDDGRLDIFLTGGKKDDALFIQQEEFFFVNEADLMGLTSILDGLTTMGVAVGDINNDGWKDLFVTTFIGEPNKLLLNQGGQGFLDISNSSGVGESSFSTSATFADFNKDGFLDLHVSNYVYKTHFVTGSNYQDSIAHECFDDFLYLNNGDMTFTKVNDLYGLQNFGCTLAGMFTDFDLDLDIDLILANDFGAEVERNKLYVNQFPLTEFVNEAESLAADEGIYAMGIASSDYDRDGDLDYYFTNIGKNVLLNQQNNKFVNVADIAGVEDEFEEGGFAVGWGCQFIDFDNDGWDDLFVSNGHIPSLDAISNPEENRSNFFINQRDGTFMEARDESGLADAIFNRGSAMGDLDNDGDLDLVVVGLRTTSNNSPLTRVYLNTSEHGNHFVQIELKSHDVNSHPYGAICKLYTPSGMILKEYQTDGSFCSVNSETLHFGLGASDQIDSLVVYWPKDGAKRTYINLISDEKNVLYDNVISSVSIKNTSPLLIYPNPVEEILNVITDKSFEGRVFIYDHLGRLEYTSEFEKRMDLSLISPGMKMIVIKDLQNRQIEYQRFVKN